VVVARRLGDPGCLAYVLGVPLVALCEEPETLPERLDMAIELSELAGTLGDPLLGFNVGLALYFTATQAADLDRARAGLATATRLADDLGQPALRIRTMFAQAGLALLEGRFADVERRAEEALRLGSALGTPDHVPLHQIMLAVVRLFQGRSRECAELAAPAVEAVPPHPFLRSAMACVYAEAGQLARARSIVADLGGATLSNLALRTYAATAALAMLASTAVVLGDRDLARRVHEELLPARHQMVVTQAFCLGPTAHYLGRLSAFLGNAEAADEHFAFAAALQERTGARGWLVHTRLEWARLLVERGAPGDEDRARMLAAAAAELAEELDTPVLAERARELLAMKTAGAGAPGPVRAAGESGGVG
jgi:hypothetical protein